MIPEALYDQARVIAESRNIAIEDVFASALADHFVRWQRIQGRAAYGDRKEFLAVLDGVPNCEPEDYDRIVRYATDVSRTNDPRLEAS